MEYFEKYQLPLKTEPNETYGVEMANDTKSKCNSYAEQFMIKSENLGTNQSSINLQANNYKSYVIPQETGSGEFVHQTASTKAELREVPHSDLISDTNDEKAWDNKPSRFQRLYCEPSGYNYKYPNHEKSKSDNAVTMVRSMSVDKEQQQKSSSCLALNRDAEDIGDSVCLRQMKQDEWHTIENRKKDLNSRNGNEKSWDMGPLNLKDRKQHKDTSKAERKMYKENKNRLNVECDSFIKIKVKQKRLRLRGDLRIAQCPVCKFDFQNDKVLRKHVKKHKEKIFECEQCPRLFVTAKGLKRHLEVHQKLQGYKCKTCDYIFTTLEDLQRHNEINCTSSHRPNLHLEPYKRTPARSNKGCHKYFDEYVNGICEICEKVFDSLLELQDHAMSHANYKPFTCSGCGNKYSRLSHLRRHQKEFTPSAVECEHCKRVFSRNETLKRHQQSACPALFPEAHLIPRPHVCEICQKGFAQKAHLQVHVRRHEADKPFKCHLCQFQTVLASELGRHVKTHAIKTTSEREQVDLSGRLVCGTCGVTFSRVSSLRRHQGKHVENQHLGCNLCGQRYYRADALTRHIHSQHQNQP